MISAIVGANGDIAKNLLLPLLRQLGTVNLADKDSSADAWEKVWQSEVIWLAVPRDEVSNVIKGAHLSSKQLVVDVCSIKRRISKQIKATGAIHLSLHPLHGPHIPLSGQRWVVINASQTRNNRKAKHILSFLRKLGINFIQCDTEDKHDFMMGVTLSLPELLTVAMDCLIFRYSEKCGRKKPDLNEMMEWAVPASNALFSVYVRAIVSSAAWLRKDLLLGSFSNLVGASLETFGELSKMTMLNIEELLLRQRDLVAKISQKEVKRVNRWIEKWYVDSTQKIFSKKFE